MDSENSEVSLVEVSRNSSQSTRRKHWCFTLHCLQDLSDVVVPVELPSSVRYTIFQQELCPTTGSHHLQGYIVFSVDVRFNQAKSGVQSLFSTTRSPAMAYIRGTPQQNIEYCSKLESRLAGTFPVELGSRPRGSGSKKASVTPLIRDAILARKTPMQVLSSEEDSAVWSYAQRYSKSWWSLLGELLPHRTGEVDPTVIVMYGVPRAGKSKLAHELYPNAYLKPSGKWWDRYYDEKEVIYDDFDGSCLSFGDWKQIVDRYKYLIEFKGGSLPLQATTHVFTTNVHPTCWWSAKVLGQHGVEALYGRITEVWYFAEVQGGPRKMTVAEFRAEIPCISRTISE